MSTVYMTQTNTRRHLALNTKWLCFFSIVSIFFAAACGPTLTRPTATPIVLGDCFWPATAVAWLDANGNGTREETEQPLAGIEFVLEPSVYSRATSGADGVAAILATAPATGEVSCSDLFAGTPPQVIAVGYSGYELTTSQALDYVSPDERYEFGFQPVAEAAVLTSTPTAAAAESAPILIETDTYEGVIFSAADAADFVRWVGVAAEAVWTPEAAQIAVLEEGLAAFLQENDYRGSSSTDSPPLWERLPEYKRQYLGFEEAGQQFIYANYFCYAPGNDWQQQPLIVEDGGDCYFQVTYSVDTNSFVSIYINGEA